MGQAKSRERRENTLLSKKTHFTKREIHDLRNKVDASINSTKANITQEVFKETVKKYVPSVSSNDDVFLEQLYSAFDVNNDKSIEFCEFVDGLSVFMKGNPEEKLSLSFKLYDVDHDSYLTKEELEKVMLKLSSTFSKDDETAEIKEIVEQMFKDFDIDNDGKLSFEEYKLSQMKEPLIVDFLEQFLSEHHISNHYSRTTSIDNRSPSSSSGRLSIRLSQAELLDYTHQRLNNNSPIEKRSLSRPTSMTSLDAAITSMEVGENNLLRTKSPTLSK